MFDTKFYDLPWHIQLALGGGYTAYIVAYSGIRSHHKAIDTAFRAIAFGLIVVLALAILPPDRPVYTGIIAFCAAVTAGVLWRIIGVAGIPRLLRALDISWADDSPSAWAKMQGDSRYPITQVAVELDNGTWLLCYDAYRFKDEPFGPCLFGTDGDVALYVTNKIEKGDTEQASNNVIVDGYGSNLTWVPAKRVRQLVVRRKTELTFLQRLKLVLWGRWPG